MSNYFPDIPEDVEEEHTTLFSKELTHLQAYPTPFQEFASFVDPTDYKQNSHSELPLYHDNFSMSSPVSPGTYQQYPYSDNQTSGYNNYSNQNQFHLLRNTEEEQGFGNNQGNNYMYGFEMEHSQKRKREVTKRKEIDEDKTSDYSPSNDGYMEEYDDNYNQDDASRSSRTYSCSFPSCGLIFHKLGELRDHLTSHGDSFKSHTVTQAGSFACTECDSTFRRLPDLQRHNRSIHSNAKPFVCPHRCGKAFSRKDALKRHLGCKTNAPCAGLRRNNKEN